MRAQEDNEIDFLANPVDSILNCIVNIVKHIDVLYLCLVIVWILSNINNQNKFCLL